jgi:hypothetical protein
MAKLVGVEPGWDVGAAAACRNSVRLELFRDGCLGHFAFRSGVPGVEHVRLGVWGGPVPFREVSAEVADRFRRQVQGPGLAAFPDDRDARPVAVEAQVPALIDKASSMRQAVAYNTTINARSLRPVLVDWSGAAISALTASLVIPSGRMRGCLARSTAHASSRSQR